MKAENLNVQARTIHIAVVDVESLARNWWLVLLRGIAGVLFAVFTFVAPTISLTALVLLFGAYAFVDGVLSVVSAIRHRAAIDRWWMLLLEGLVGIGAGVVTFLWPGITALALLYIIAAWSLLTGAFEVAAAIRLRKVITGEWLLALIGIASIAFGVLLVIFPREGALAITLWIGAYALVVGVLLIVLAFRLRSWGKSHGPGIAHAMA